VTKKQSSNGKEDCIDNIDDIVRLMESMVTEYELSIYAKVLDALKKDQFYAKARNK
jgi:hypothetical protein